MSEPQPAQSQIEKLLELVSPRIGVIKKLTRAARCERAKPADFVSRAALAFRFPKRRDNRAFRRRKIFISPETELKFRNKFPQNPETDIMSDKRAGEITLILQDWNNGDAEAGERLLPFVYKELKRQARFLMSRERSNHTLQPTALVHEAFLKLTDLTEIKWNDRSHFYRFVSHLMRQILVDHARQYAATKRGNRTIHFSIDDLQIPVEERADAILRLDEALERLARFDERQAKIVEMRYFGGMKAAEIAAALGISERSVGREWQAARLWLYRELNQK
jgi:RNA polymerase sigma factor (TIGR02999 family)